MASMSALLSKRSVAEQFVGQELLAYAKPYMNKKLYYWARDKKSSHAEIDYVIHRGSTIYPIEVKAGATGRMKSIHAFFEFVGGTKGLRLSQHPLRISGNILSIPLYMLFEMDRLLG